MHATAREIPKHPDAIPGLCAKAVELVSSLCFHRDDAFMRSSFIFVFGSRIQYQGLVRSLETLLRNGVSERVVIAGGVPHYEKAPCDKPESELIYEAIDPKTLSSAEFLLEKRSANTLDNVRNAIEEFDLRGPGSITFVAQSFLCGRAFLTLKKFFPRTHLFQLSSKVFHPVTGEELTRENWHRAADFRARVWGEFLRLRTYSMRGDIFLDEKTGRAIGEIDALSKPS